jgi:branched-chain amino acid transport system permease protein
VNTPSDATGPTADILPEGQQILDEARIAAVPGEIAPPSPRGDLAWSLKEAFFAGLVALGMFTPMIGLLTDQNINNEVILVTRWPLLAAVVIACAVGRFVIAYVIRPWIAARRAMPAKPVVARPAWRVAVARWFPVVGVLLLIFFPPLVLANVGIAGSIKWVDNFGVQILIYVMLGWGLNVVVGLAGLLDLGYVAFYAVGAYAYALLATHLGLSFWLLLPLAGFLAACWGVALGFPVLRLRGDYLAIVTLAFGEIVHLVLLNWREVTGGGAGILSIPKITLFGIRFDASPDGFAAMFGLPISSAYYKIFLYYLILGLAFITAFATSRMRNLPIGRAWESMREDEIACRSLGINTVTTKLTAFAIGAMFGGFAGSFFAARQGSVFPDSFTFIESVFIVAIVVLGGMGSMIGVAVAATVMIGGVELLRELTFLKQVFGDDFNPTQYRMLIFGFAMVVIMLWRPRGFVQTRTPSVFLFRRKAISADMVGEGHG